MSLKGSSKWKAAAFDSERKARVTEPQGVPFVHNSTGWILFGPRDVRSSQQQYHFALQRLNCDKQVRVRVGCRYYTLPQAWKHWSEKARRSTFTCGRNEGKQALAIIQLMILQAQAYGLLNRYKTIKFDSSIVKRRAVP